MTASLLSMLVHLTLIAVVSAMLAEQVSTLKLSIFLNTKATLDGSEISPFAITLGIVTTTSLRLADFKDELGDTQAARELLMSVVTNYSYILYI